MRVLLLVLTLTLVGAPACHAPVTITTPQGQAAYTADQVTLRVTELEKAAISANATAGLPEATTRTIVQFCVSSYPVLRAVPSGWNASLQQAWASTKQQLPAITNPAIVAAMAAVDVVLGVTQ